MCSCESSNFEKKSFSIGKFQLIAVDFKYIYLGTFEIDLLYEHFIILLCGIWAMCARVSVHSTCTFPFGIYTHMLTWLRSRTHILRLSAFKNTFARNRPAERACMHSVIIMTYVATLQKCKLVATFFPCLLLYFFHHFRFFRLFWN